MAEYDLTPLPSEQHNYPNRRVLTERELHVRRERVFIVLAGLFLGTLAMLNILGISRFIFIASWGPGADGGGNAWLWGQGNDQTLWNFALAVGVLPYPITFLCTDLISELYGRKRANFVVFTGLLLNAWIVFILWLGGVLPGTESAAFFDIRKLAFGAVGASMVAYFVAQFVDVQVFHFWKRLTKGKLLWLRNNGSTLVSQFVDTTAVILVTHFYANALPLRDNQGVWTQLMIFIATGYVFKLLVALIDTGPFYAGTHILTRFLRLPPPGAEATPVRSPEVRSS